MTKTTLKIDGMMCAMCEAHVNDAIRNAFDVKKVTSSHKDSETVIISENPLDEKCLNETINNIGYKMLDMSSESYKKSGRDYLKFCVKS